MDVIGGVAKAELLDGQASAPAGPPGVLGFADDVWAALGSAEFLRAWVEHPAFLFLKQPPIRRGTWERRSGVHPPTNEPDAYPTGRRLPGQS